MSISRIGVIGLGFGSRYITNALDLGYKVKQAAGGIEKFQNNVLQKGYDVEIWHSDWRKMQFGLLDWLVIASPPHNRLEIIEKAIKENVNIICEKPVCLRKRELDQIDYLVNNRDYTGKFVVNFTDFWADNITSFFSYNEYISNENLKLSCFGSGPERDYSAFLDWGIHPLAVVCELSKTKCVEKLRIESVISEDKNHGSVKITDQANNKYIVTAGNKGDFKLIQYNSKAYNYKREGNSIKNLLSKLSVVESNWDLACRAHNLAFKILDQI